jgi:hypothetical protein
MNVSVLLRRKKDSLACPCGIFKTPSKGKNRGIFKHEKFKKLLRQHTASIISLITPKSTRITNNKVEKWSFYF